MVLALLKISNSSDEENSISSQDMVININNDKDQGLEVDIHNQDDFVTEGTLPSHARGKGAHIIPYCFDGEPSAKEFDFKSTVTITFDILLNI